MAPVSRSAKDEASFMADLLVGLDDSFWNAVPTPEPSPAKPSTSHQCKTPLKQKRHIPNPVTSALPYPAPATLPPPSKVLSADDINIAELLEGAENWDWDDDLLTPKKSPPKVAQTTSKAPQPSSYNPEPCTRCKVESITEINDHGRYQRNLIVKLDKCEERRLVILRDDWAWTDVCSGDTINVIGPFTFDTPSTSSTVSSISITSKSNLLILHPDLLLTATALSDATQCRRKPLLSNLVRSTSATTPALVWGNMLHEVMQSCFTSGRWEESWMNEKIDEIVHKGLSELLKLEVSVEHAKREVRARAKGLLAFSQKYLSQTPKPDAVLSNTRAAYNQAPSLLSVTKLLDVEEDIWSPSYGLKGKLDVSVHAIIADPNPPFPKPIISSGPKPFEIKTGRAIAAMEHRAQTMLYALLTAERYGVEVNTGLLYYTQTEEVVRVPASRNELRGLFTARNEMASYMIRRIRHHSGGQKDDMDVEDASAPEPFLPPTIDDERTCKRCYALDTCMLYRKAVENVVDKDSPIADTYELKTSHITPSRGAFFKKWEGLIALEEQDMTRFKKELWTMGAAEREAKGRCFGNMVIDASFRPKDLGAGALGDSRIHRFTYKFVKAHAPGVATTASLLNGQLHSGDGITVSVEPGLLALARGFILDLTPTEIVLGVDHELCTKKISERLSGLDHSSRTKQVIFRIDRDELFSGLGRIRDNLAQLFYAEGDTRRLKLVVDLQPPVFDDCVSIKDDPLFAHHSAHLDVNQQQAMSKVLSAHDYALILGMPGTGKTTVIAAMIKTLIAMGKTVLLTSYTHSAVDTILAKLTDADFGILRLGNIDKIHPDVHKFTLAHRKTPTTIEQLEQQLMAPPVVATTCLSIDHALFSRRKFDYCIVDEASQITLPTCLGPLRFADKFVLVGDHFQLPPLVRSHAAQKGGLDVSLFRRLSDAHPHAVVDLAYQYRMNADIMLLSNKLIYGDRLRCGSVKVARQSLVLPKTAFLRRLHAGGLSCHSDECWIERLASDSCKAVFVDTDALPAPDSRVGDLVQNTTEAELVRQVVETLLRSGIREDQMGVISLYRQQVKLFSHIFHNRKEIELLTADRSQGRDKDCIIISMVRSNDGGHIGDLVKDWRRMNVSFTRARSKLIIVGSRTTLQHADLLAAFFNLMDSRGWILRLPPKAHQLHSCLMESGPALPVKRIATEMDKSTSATGKENPSIPRPVKKAKIRATADNGLLRGRPILQDLVNAAS